MLNNAEVYNEQSHMAAIAFNSGFSTQVVYRELDNIFIPCEKDL